MSLYVVSDLHIWGADDPLYLSLLSLVRDLTQSGDTVILAGDIFDLYLGNKSIFRSRYDLFFSVLRDAGRRGVCIHYIEGNHDFLIKRAFQGIEGLQTHPHHVVAHLNGKRFFVAHGDTVDRGDYGYRALRGFFRSPIMRALVAILPGRWLEKIGNKSSQESRKRSQKVASTVPAGIERLETLRRIYRNFAAERLAEGFDYVVLGHCHDLDEMKFTIGGRSGQYVNVGYPRVHGSFLSWQPGESEICRQRLP